ncbi:SDR family NAD(P)-dependent oxidoreductase [Fluviicola taffensis]|uniref:Short-chain dehydrogenase/reductase SDR n=1 Tax=Fluviicola taffensis (strain DSM 16823 / NCIMB 13979 / RW262) TaxID=755732 RepID=F2IBC4_FLUTR|nr:SDR family NAD(P)-dependent oxidoreductase [Fluviicola taffensis]AEA43210.1 short-chain dehydrogenase/reductase SDR [Fluviicola taffensis DSM 16823]
MIIITGTSKGIGRAITENYLSLGEKVIGIGRNHTISNPNYTALSCDLSNQELVNQIPFTDLGEEPIIFIHNAGILGEVDYFEKLGAHVLVEVMQVNLFAGASILQKLLKQIPKEQSFKAIFISSGAGKNPIASWASYCASKAAVDLFCETIQLEEEQLGRLEFKCLSVAPGVVDTEMQATIRATTSETFSEIERFKEYKNSNQLYSPELVAKKLHQLIHEMPINQVQYSLRDINV